QGTKRPPTQKRATTTHAVCLASSSLVSLTSSADRSFRRAPELPVSHPKRPETELRERERERGEGRACARAPPPGSRAPGSTAKI
uniref:Uncharacterized protein n=1 Tax=Oryza nivara TaxID=4536 RepID=A0A0E0J236_ORYNI